MDASDPFAENSPNPYISSTLDEDYYTEENVQYLLSMIKNFSIDYPRKYENCKLEITIPQEQGYISVMLNNIQFLKTVPYTNIMYGISLITFGRKEIDRPSTLFGYGCCEVDFEAQYAEENGIPQIGLFRISITPDFYKHYLYDTEKSKLKDGVSFKFIFY